MLSIVHFSVVFVFTSVLALQPWSYCMHGPAYGFPFPVLYPSHGEHVWHLIHIALEPSPSSAMQFSPLSFAANLVIFGVIYSSLFYLLKHLLRRV